MDDTTSNIEISNPMFGGDDFDYDVGRATPEVLSLGQTFAIDVEDKVSLSCTCS